jgi:hypothetical protein
MPSGRARGEATSAAYSSICEHWREPCNAEWRPQAQFFNSLLKSKMDSSHGEITEDDVVKIQIKYQAMD